MKIDWFTLIAQIINFFVLLWLLKTFLFGRILKAMQDRDASIAKQLAEAERLRQEAAAEGELVRMKMREFDEKGEVLLLEAKQEAAHAKEELLERAAADAKSARSIWARDLEREQTELLKNFRVEIGQQVLRTAQKVVSELANVDMQKLIAKNFLDKLTNLPETERKELASAIQNEGNRIRVLTSFELEPPQREEVVEAIHQALEKKAHVDFDILPEGTIGMELRTEAHSIPWTLDRHMEEMEDRILHTLRQGNTQHAG